MIPTLTGVQPRQRFSRLNGAQWLERPRRMAKAKPKTADPWADSDGSEDAGPAASNGSSKGKGKKAKPKAKSPSTARSPLLGGRASADSTSPPGRGSNASGSRPKSKPK